MLNNWRSEEKRQEIRKLRWWLVRYAFNYTNTDTNTAHVSSIYIHTSFACLLLLSFISHLLFKSNVAICSYWIRDRELKMERESERKQEREGASRKRVS